MQILYMTDINMAVNKRCRAGVRRMVKHNLRVDMTPMVDLGFLLITFFVITTELAKPTVMDLFMPKDGIDSEIGNSNALTIIPDAGNTLFYYFGNWKDALRNGVIHKTTYAGNGGIRDVIIRKQKQLDNDVNSKEKRNGLMLLIKPTNEASYKNVVDMLDEATINMVKRYAVMKISAEEKNWLKKKGY